MPRLQSKRFRKSAQALDLILRARQSWAHRDSPEELETLLSDHTAPPSELVKQLIARKLIGPDDRFEVLYGGRTNQVWKVLSGDIGAVLKLYRAQFRNPLFRNDAKLEAACLQALGDTGFVPKLRATGAFGPSNWVYYDHAPGSPWQEGVEGVARLLQHLHQRSVKLDAPPGCNGSDDLDRHAQQILALCPSDKADRLRAIRPWQDVAPLPNRSLIHGDPVAGNILQADDGMTLIDWQCPAWGDPCEDLAMFLSPAMQQLYRGAPLAPTEEAQFLAAYGDAHITRRYRTLQPWYAWRMAAYCLWRAENGAPDYAKGYELEVATL